MNEIANWWLPPDFDWLDRVGAGAGSVDSRSRPERGGSAGVAKTEWAVDSAGHARADRFERQRTKHSERGWVGSGSQSDRARAAQQPAHELLASERPDQFDVPRPHC